MASSFVCNPFKLHAGMEIIRTVAFGQLPRNDHQRPCTRRINQCSEVGIRLLPRLCPKPKSGKQNCSPFNEVVGRIRDEMLGGVRRRHVSSEIWTAAEAAKMFMVSPVTARKWAARWRAEGVDGMQDRSSRPRTSPAKTPQPVVRVIVALRWRHRLGPVQIGGRLGIPVSTVHAVLVRCRLNRLSRIDRVTGKPIRRYERTTIPGR